MVAIGTASTSQEPTEIGSLVTQYTPIQGNNQHKSKPYIWWPCVQKFYLKYTHSLMHPVISYWKYAMFAPIPCPFVRNMWVRVFKHPPAFKDEVRVRMHVLLSTWYEPLHTWAHGVTFYRVRMSS